jgi:chaperonin GroES
MPVTPLRDYILVKKSEAPETSPGGIVLTPKVPALYNEGVVVRTGDKVKDVAANMTVVFQNRTGMKVTRDGEEYLLLPESEILGIISK